MLSAFDRWLSAEPEPRCPECGWNLPDGPDDHLPEDERHVCSPWEEEPIGVGDPD